MEIMLHTAHEIVDNRIDSAVEIAEPPSGHCKYRNPFPFDRVQSAALSEKKKNERESETILRISF